MSTVFSGLKILAVSPIKRTPLTTAEVDRVVETLPDVPKTHLQWAPGQEPAPGPVGEHRVVGHLEVT